MMKNKSILEEEYNFGIIDGFSAEQRYWFCKFDPDNTEHVTYDKGFKEGQRLKMIALLEGKIS